MSRVSTRHFSAPRNWRKRIVNGLSSIASAPSRVPSVNKSKDTSIETQRQRASFSEQILIDYEAQLACESISSESSFVCSFNELWESRMSPHDESRCLYTISSQLRTGSRDSGNPL